MEWNPQGTRKRGRPRTWQWTALNELNLQKKSWVEVKALAANRNRWKSFTWALCSTMMVMMNIQYGCVEY
jgi:hypothetical protein